MLNFRLALHVPENRLLQISGEGKLEGLTKLSVREACIYFFTKINTTWIHPNKDLRTSSQVAIDNVKKVALDEADGAHYILQLNDVLQDGPESALKQMSSGFLLIVLIGLTFMIHFTQVAQGWKHFLNSAWVLYTHLLRQPIPAAVYDIRRQKMTTFVLDISACQSLAGGSNELQVIPVTDFLTGNQDSSWCVASGKCAMVLNDLDRNLLQSFACSLNPEGFVDNPPYLSSSLSSALSGYVFNKRIPKKQLDRINGYIQTSFEMGLVKNKGFFSRDFSVKTARALTQLNADEECLSKKIQNSLSTPVPLSNEFFKNCFLLYLVIILMAMIIHLISLQSMECIQSSVIFCLRDREVNKTAVSLEKKISTHQTRLKIQE